MKRAIVIALAIASFATTASAATYPLNVSTVPAVQRALHNASQYFGIIAPTLQSPCPLGVTVLVQPMQSSDYLGGTIPGSEVWAQTVLSSCEIDLSPDFYRFLMRRGDPNQQVLLPMPVKYCDQGVAVTVPSSSCSVAHSQRGQWAQAYACAVIVHEYGHVLGLDTNGDGQVGMPLLPIMNGAGPYDVPQCNLDAYGWKHISQTDKSFLTQTVRTQ